MDLHVSQHFPYYRYREEALCWSDRKPSVEDVGHPASVNSRILELRKEKSRDAARSRRGKENYEFYELAKMLPLPAAITSQLDKASIIRLTISYLKLRDFSGHGDPPWSRDKPAFSKSINSGVTSTTANIAHEIFEHHQGTHILQSLDGFAFALGIDGRFLYISETVSIYLGLSQVEMTGSSLFDYVHHQDHSEVAEQLGLGLNNSGQGSLGSPQSSEEGTTSSPVSTVMTLNSTSTYKGFDRTFCVRMKSTLTKRGCHFKSSGYRVVLLLCRLRPQYQFSHSRKSSPPLLGMVALAIALPPPSVHEIRLESDMFVTRLNFDFSIAHCEPRVSELLDYTADEITGMNMYTLCHGEDAHRLRKSHIDLINKGQVLTHYYRVMNKNGGYTWVQTCATVVCNSKNADEQNIICVNYVVSGREYKNLIMDCCQLEDHVASRGVKREDTSGNDPENGSPGSDTGEGRSTGGPHHPERHLAGPDLEEDGTEGPGEQRGRGIMDHTTQLHDHSQINNVLTRPVKKVGNERRGVKRKVGEEESSCSSDEEERSVGVRKRYPVLSPASSSCHSSALAASPKAPPEDSDGGGTSVKDLEQAMSKHLPAMDKSATPSAHQPTDFSTDTLLKAQQQRSTIQWIGTHHHLSHLGGQQTGSLPASTLLRQLYAANRESVIRANVQAGRSGPGYYSDMNHSGPLPTPPGSDGSYSDQFVLHNQKNDFGLYSGGGYTVDYHSAMTPPSSVSPRDKHQQQIHSGFESPVYSEVLRHQYLGGEAPAQPLPLKPQPYPMHPGALDYATTSLDQQFYHHSAPSTGFHLYHPSNKTTSVSPGVYTDPLKNTSNWYSTPS
ncbi:protein trachealess isoform X3 [Halyomorpha halys]|uniref:protein trachealess isoform X3 n=1 Tax=Halyomorpha halys TaxID=286706 RepID=UPI0006D4F8D1|nr:protein trachealess isoform X3 [Halyomorpha halys]